MYEVGNASSRMYDNRLWFIFSPDLLALGATGPQEHLNSAFPAGLKQEIQQNVS